MAFKSAKAKGCSVKAHQGDAKTLLGFNFEDRKSTENLAGFTIQAQPKGQDPYYIHNMLQFKVPGDHAQDPKEPPNSSINAPIHKFRWLHIPGSVHQGTQPFRGPYTYTVTPRYFDVHQSMLPLDQSRSVSVTIDVVPFKTGRLALGFTRGFVQSQAFVHHFGLKAMIRPKGKDLLFKTDQESGTNAAGEHYTFAEEYDWLGFTARERIFEILNTVLADKSLHLDMFAYDLNEPDAMFILLKLAAQGRVRIILDNAALHHSTKDPKPEDQFESKFNQAKKGAAGILRGKFGRYSHDKILIVSDGKPKLVLTGSTNYSVTGLYVNSNHVLVFSDPAVAGKYAQVFQAAWDGKAKQAAFSDSALAKTAFPFSTATLPKMEVTFSPHDAATAKKVLDGIAARVAKEGRTSGGSVLFAVMQMDKGTGPVFPALRGLHSNQDIFTYGISDSPGGIALYAVGKKTGVLVTGKPVGTILPSPFDQVPGVGAGHQVHHKFIVCGFGGKDPVVYCGSSNLAQGGEESNGDNLLAIHDEDVATAFAIEALALVDHFDFLNRQSQGLKAKGKKPPASKQQGAINAGWFLSTTDKWSDPYFDPKDLHSVDRELFA